MNIIQEHINNLARIWRMTIISVRDEFRGARFGIFWEFLRIGIFFTVHGMFFIVIRQKAGIPYELYAALLPWQFISSCINQTPKIYKSQKVLVTTIRFPLSIIPTYDVLSKFIIHISAIIVIMPLFTWGGFLSWSFLYLLYYYAALLCLLISMMTILSVVCSLSKDVYKMWQVLTRIFLYLNPIFWNLGKIESMLKNYPDFHFIITIIKLNPFVYIFEGFRSAMLTTMKEDFGKYLTVGYVSYFWLAVITLFLIGSMVQKKAKKFLPDML